MIHALKCNGQQQVTQSVSEDESQKEAKQVCQYTFNKQNHNFYFIFRHSCDYYFLVWVGCPN